MGNEKFILLVNWEFDGLGVKLSNYAIDRLAHSCFVTSVWSLTSGTAIVKLEIRILHMLKQNYHVEL